MRAGIDGWLIQTHENVMQYSRRLWNDLYRSIPCGWRGLDTVYRTVTIVTILLLASMIAVQAQTLPRAFPSAKWAWYLSSTPTSDWKDEQGNTIMTKEQIVEWMADHADWYLAGPISGWASDIIWQRRPGIPIDRYVENFYINALWNDDWIYIGNPNASSRMLYLDQRLAQAGQRRAYQMFDPVRHAREVEGVYNGLIHAV